MYFITYSISVIIKLYMYMTTDNLLQSWLVTAHRSQDFYKGEWLVHLAPVTVLLQTVYPLTCISWPKTENWTTPNCYCILPCMHNVHYVCVCVSVYQCALYTTTAEFFSEAGEIQNHRLLRNNTFCVFITAQLKYFVGRKSIRVL